MQDKLERFTTHIDSLRAALDIPGLSIAILKNQDIIHAVGLGFADREREEKASPNTPYMIASLSKTFASVILLQLVEEGLLDLDWPMAQCHPDFPGLCKEIEASDSPLAQHYDWRQETITVRHHFTHTAQGVPGTRYGYNTFLFKRLSDVVENVSGRRYRDLLVERIFRKLGLTESAPELLDVEFEDIVSRLARPYAYDSERGLVAVPPPDYPRVTASAGIVSTVMDLARFDIAIDHSELLKRETQEMAWTNPATGSGVLPYGLGWFSQPRPSGRYVWHYGWHPASYSALYLKIPERGFTLLLLANGERLSAPFGLRDGDVLRSPFAVLFLDIVVGETL